MQGTFPPAGSVWRPATHSRELVRLVWWYIHIYGHAGRSGARAGAHTHLTGRDVGVPSRVTVGILAGLLDLTLAGQ